MGELVIRHDLFVRQVVVDGRTYPVGRLVLLEGGHAFLWTTIDGHRHLAGQASNGVLERDRSVPGRYTVTTEDDTWEMVKASCGCGNPLKRLNVRAEIRALGVTV